MDVASVMAMGFPATRGGLIFWADLVGADYICKRLNEWSAMFAGAGLGGFFKPCGYLERAAQSRTKLEAGKAPQSKL